jgi:hypothetical protein
MTSIHIEARVQVVEAVTSRTMMLLTKRRDAK